MKKHMLIFFLLFFWGIVFSNEVKVMSKSFNNNTSSKKAELLEDELNNLKDRKSQALKTLHSLDDKLEKYREKEIERDEELKKTKEDLKKLKFISGNSDVKGPGVILKIDKLNLYLEKNDYNFIGRDYLLRILNILKQENIEAICINNQRVTFNTGIYVKDNHLNINDKNINTPYEIKVIGNPIKIEKRLNMRFGLFYNIRKDNIFKINIEKKEDIEISRYTDTIQFKYAKPRK